MNINKAREFFSSYYENTLDPGLRQSFQRALETDAQIQAEYRAFESVLGELNILRDAPVEVPFNLHDKICQRIDLQILDQKHKSPSFFGGIWRSLALGGVAAVAIVAAFLAMNSRNDQSTAAGVASVSSPIGPRVQVDNRATYLSVGARNSTISIRKGVDGPVVSEFKLNGERLRSPLLNESADPVLLCISESGSKTKLYVAIPGKRRWSAESGEGTIAEMAKAISGFYQVPVELQSPDLDKSIGWKFSGSDPVDSIEVTNGKATLNIEQRSSGVLSVIEH